MLDLWRMDTVALVFFGIAFACAVAWNVLYPRLLAQLRARHTATWEQLGCPRYIELRYRPTAAALRFLLKRHYLVLGDRSLVSLAAWLRVTLIGTWGGLALFAILMLATLGFKE